LLCVILSITFVLDINTGRTMKTTTIEINGIKLYLDLSALDPAARERWLQAHLPMLEAHFNEKAAPSWKDNRGRLNS
jgi:hypothetical protein